MRGGFATTRSFLLEEGTYWEPLLRMEISIQELKMYLLIRFLGRAQLEAVGKGLLVSI